MKGDATSVHGEHDLFNCGIWAKRTRFRHPINPASYFPTKLQAHFAEIHYMTSTTKNVKTSLNVLGCLALLHAIRSNKPPKRTRLRTARSA